MTKEEAKKIFPIIRGAQKGRRLNGAAKITRRMENGIVHYTVILPDEA